MKIAMMHARQVSHRLLVVIAADANAHVPANLVNAAKTKEKK